MKIIKTFCNPSAACYCYCFQAKLSGWKFMLENAKDYNISDQLLIFIFFAHPHTPPHHILTVLSIILFSWTHTSPCHELLFSFLCYCPCGLNNTRAACTLPSSSSYSLDPITWMCFKLKVNLMDLIPLFLWKKTLKSF